MDVSRVLADRPAPGQNAQREPELSQHLCAGAGDQAKPCSVASCVQGAPELDVSPAWRRAMQCLSETGLSVFCPSKRRRMSAQL